MAFSRTMDGDGPFGGFGGSPQFSRRPGLKLPSEPMLRQLAAVAAAVALLAPLLLARVPVLEHYPEHLARLGLLVPGEARPDLAALGRLLLRFRPGLAMDASVALLAQAMPLAVAARLLLALAIGLPPLGSVLLHRAWFGRGMWWPWLALLTGVNAFVLLGLLDYQLGIGLALIGAAWHARRGGRRWGPAALAGMAGWGVACAAAHPMALAVLLLAMLSTLSGRARGPVRAGAVMPVAAAAVAPLLLYLLGAALGADGADGLWSAIAGGIDWHPVARALWLLSPFATAATWLGEATALLVLAPLVWSGWRRRLTVAPEARVALAGLALAYLVLPGEPGETGLVFQRAALPLALVAIAGLRPRLDGPVAECLVIGCVMLIGFRGAAVANAWQAREQAAPAMGRAAAAASPVAARSVGAFVHL